MSTFSSMYAPLIVERAKSEVLCVVCAAASTTTRCTECRTPYCGEECRMLDWVTRHGAECRDLKLLRKEEDAAKRVGSDFGTGRAGLRCECPICMEVRREVAFYYQACCGKRRCEACTLRSTEFCPFCRTKTPTSKVRLVELLRKRHERGDTHATTMLADHYRKGSGVGEDRVQARDLYRRAAGRGDSRAAQAIGCLYDSSSEAGQAPPGDYDDDDEDEDEGYQHLAFRWYTTASELGDACATFNLSVLCFDLAMKEPKTVDGNPTELALGYIGLALKNELRAAEQGYHRALQKVVKRSGYQKGSEALAKVVRAYNSANEE